MSNTSTEKRTYVSLTTWFKLCLFPECWVEGPFVKLQTWQEKLHFISLFLLLLSSILLAVHLGQGEKVKSVIRAKVRQISGGNEFQVEGITRAKAAGWSLRHLMAAGGCAGLKVRRCTVRTPALPRVHGSALSTSKVKVTHIHLELNVVTGLLWPSQAETASLEVSATHTFLCKTKGLSCPSGAPELPPVVSFSL